MSVSVIQSELSALSVKELRERAATIGVDDDAIEDARDGDSPKSDIIALIDSKEALLRAERFRAERVAKTLLKLIEDGPPPGDLRAA